MLSGAKAAFAQPGPVMVLPTGRVWDLLGSLIGLKQS